MMVWVRVKIGKHEEILVPGRCVRALGDLDPTWKLKLALLDETAKASCL